MSNGGRSPTESPKGELTQRITRQGRVLEYIEGMVGVLSCDDSEIVYLPFRKIEPPKEKEKESESELQKVWFDIRDDLMTQDAFESYIQQREQAARKEGWERGQESVLLYPKDSRPTFADYEA